MGFSMSQTMMLVFTVNIAAAVGAMGFGHVQDNLGHKPALAITLCGWLLMIVLAATATGAGQFWASAVVAGLWIGRSQSRSEEHTSELQSRGNLVCRLLLEKKK